MPWAEGPDARSGPFAGLGLWTEIAELERSGPGWCRQVRSRLSTGLVRQGPELLEMVDEKVSSITQARGTNHWLERGERWRALLEANLNMVRSTTGYPTEPHEALVT